MVWGCWVGGIRLRPRPAGFPAKYYFAGARAGATGNRRTCALPGLQGEVRPARFRLLFGSGDVAWATFEALGASGCLPATVRCAGIQSGVAADFLSGGDGSPLEV